MHVSLEIVDFVTVSVMRPGSGYCSFEHDKVVYFALRKIFTEFIDVVNLHLLLLGN